MHIEMNSGCIFSNHFNVEVIFEKIVVDGISARPIRAKAQKLTVQCNLIKKKKKLPNSQVLIKPPSSATVPGGVQNQGLSCLVSCTTYIPGVPATCFSHPISFSPHFA